VDSTLPQGTPVSVPELMQGNKPYEAYDKVQPEDPLTILDLDKDIQDVLAVQYVFTVRHFALCHLDEVLSFCITANQRSRLTHSHNLANWIVAKNAALPVKLVQNSAEVWGYVYVSEEFYEHTKNEKMLKSAYVLFQEYVSTPLEDRLLHPWMRIFHTYVKEASIWCGVAEPTDLDVYSYLIWRASPYFGNLDYTVGTRAIFFNWWCLRPDAHKYCLSVDKQLAKQRNDPLLEHRNDRVLQINLTAVVKHWQGKLFRIEQHEKEWVPTTLEQARARASDLNRAHTSFIPGENFYANTNAHGCIVTPTGTIPSDFIAVSDPICLD